MREVKAYRGVAGFYLISKKKTEYFNLCNVFLFMYLIAAAMSSFHINLGTVLCPFQSFESCHTTCCLQCSTEFKSKTKMNGAEQPGKHTSGQIGWLLTKSPKTNRWQNQKELFYLIFLRGVILCKQLIMKLTAETNC